MAKLASGWYDYYFPQLLMTACHHHAATKESVKTGWMAFGVIVKMGGVVSRVRCHLIPATSTNARMRGYVCRMGTPTPVHVISNTLGTVAS